MEQELKPGQDPVVGYALIERLGRGGFGEAWKLDRAVDDFNAALKLNPRCARALGSRAIVWKEMGDHARAVDDCTGSIAINPRNPVAFDFRGKIYAEQGDQARAQADLGEARRLEEIYGR